ncbi:MAG: S16 family serine protease [Halobacteriota archaeon]
MKRWYVAPIACVLLLLLTVASAGCTVSLNPQNLQLSSSQAPSGINASETSSGTAHMLAVATDERNQYTGTVSNIKVYTQPGSGHVFVETIPLTGVDFQETARDAVTVAAKQAKLNSTQRDFEFVVTTSTYVEGIDGGSAGLPMAIAAYSALTNKSSNTSVYGTGAIASDGTISSVGGVYLKAEAAAKAGARVIIVPYGETVVSTQNPLSQNILRGGVNLQDQLQKEGYNVTVVGVKTVAEALPYYFS